MYLTSVLNNGLNNTGWEEGMTIEQADSRAGTYPHPTLSSSNPNFNIET